MRVHSSFQARGLALEPLKTIFSMPRPPLRGPPDGLVQPPLNGVAGPENTRGVTRPAGRKRARVTPVDQLDDERVPTAFPARAGGRPSVPKRRPKVSAASARAELFETAIDVARPNGG